MSVANNINDTRLIIVMGPAGCGKSTVGSELAQALGADFIEGDDYHTAENKAKMHGGVALTDDDRWPWLQNLASEMRERDATIVTSCSALKKSYRTFITKHAKESVLYVYLHGSAELLASRLGSRQSHFMNKDLLDSQLETLEIPDDAEFSITVDISQSPQAVVQQIQTLLIKA